MSRNDLGEIIVTYSDGSWRYFAAMDSILLVDAYHELLEKEGKRKAIVPEVISEIETPDNSDVKDEIKDQDIKTANETKGELDNESQLAGENRLIKLTERRLTLTERIRRVESGYIQLTEKEMRKVREELMEVDAEITAWNQLPQEESEFPELNYVLEDNRQHKFEPDETRSEDPCYIAVVVDTLINQTKTRTEPQYFFEVVNESEKMLEVSASIVRLNESYVLHLYFEFYSLNADTIGPLYNGAQLGVLFVDGNNLLLKNATVETGRKQAIGQSYLYTGRYILDKDAIKALTKNYIDAIRVDWASGEATYNLYQIDLLQDQLKCLLNYTTDQ